MGWDKVVVREAAEEAAQKGLAVKGEWWESERAVSERRADMIGSSSKASGIHSDVAREKEWVGQSRSGSFCFAGAAMRGGRGGSGACFVTRAVLCRRPPAHLAYTPAAVYLGGLTTASFLVIYYICICPPKARHRSVMNERENDAIYL